MAEPERIELEDVAKVIVHGEEDWHEVVSGTLRLIGRRSPKGIVEVYFRWKGPDGEERDCRADRVWGFQMR